MLDSGAIQILVLCLPPVLVIGFDVWLHDRKGYEGTISYHVLEASKRRPVVAAAIGLLYGFLLAHLFFSQ